MSTKGYKSKLNDASRRGKEIELTEEQYEKLMSHPTCDYTGVLLTNETRSLERLDNSKGYIPGNILVVSKTANQLKSNHPHDSLLLNSSFEKGVKRLFHINRVKERLDANYKERMSIVNETKQIRDDLRAELARPREVIDADHLNTILHYCNRILTNTDKLSKLDEGVAGRLVDLSQAREIHDIGHQMVLMSQIDSVIKSGEAQRKANAHFGIKEKPSVSQRLRQFSNYFKNLLKKQSIVELDISTNRHEV